MQRACQRSVSVLLLALATACSSPTCAEETRVVEVVWGIGEDLDRLALDLYRRQGYSCRSDGALRNAFGHQIGTRHVCTRCV